MLTAGISVDSVFGKYTCPGILVSSEGLTNGRGFDIIIAI